jgi:hypothetical protein
VEEAGHAPPGVPDLTLPQYASLRVDLQMHPEQEEVTLSRYRVTRESRAALDAYWRGRFEAAPAHDVREGVRHLRGLGQGQGGLLLLGRLRDRPIAEVRPVDVRRVHRDAPGLGLRGSDRRRRAAAARHFFITAPLGVASVQ